MIADFTIVIHSEPERSVRVVVHDSIRALRSAATQYNKRWSSQKMEFQDTLGVCHRFELYEGSLCAIVRLAPPYVGVGMISHELAHAAVWIRELNEGEETVLTCANDEEFCWILGELVRQTVNKFNEKDVYERST